MKYFRFRFGGEIAFRANEPPGEITLDLIKKLLADRDAIGEWHLREARAILRDAEQSLEVCEIHGVRKLLKEYNR